MVVTGQLAVTAVNVVALGLLRVARIYNEQAHIAQIRWP
jgi:hypothetical protein